MNVAEGDVNVYVLAPDICLYLNKIKMWCFVNCLDEQYHINQRITTLSIYLQPSSYCLLCVGFCLSLVKTEALQRTPKRSPNPSLGSTALVEIVCGCEGLMKVGM